MDKDNLSKDDKIARTEFVVSTLFENPGEWKIDEKFPMTLLEPKNFPEGTPPPEIYIQIIYLSKEMLAAGSQIKPPPNIKYDLRK